MDNVHVHECAPVMRDEEDVPKRQDGDEDGDVEEPPEDAGVDDDEGEDAVATDMFFDFFDFFRFTRRGNVGGVYP